MKGIAIRQYGGPETLEWTDLADPKVGPDSVLVRVRAAGVNPVDFKIREGRLDGAFPSHFPLVPGWDVAGVVEAVGPAVWEFAPGDEVVGYVRADHIQGGTYAEYVSAHVRHLAHKPTSVGFVEAAGLPLAGLTAYQAALQALRVVEDETLLVHAAAGGVGSMAVQIGRHLGSRVIGTASAGNHAYLRDLGAEPVEYGEGLVDRVRTLAPAGVDAALDLVGGEALERTPELLGPRGRFATVVNPAVAAQLGARYVFVRPDPVGLAALVRMVDEGRLRVPVARTFPLQDAAEAHRIVQSGHGQGKIVLEVA
ncbi:MAG: NADP-dependent oxidoreductase [Actinomycetes bacterium]